MTPAQFAAVAVAGSLIAAIFLALACFDVWRSDREHGG